MSWLLDGIPLHPLFVHASVVAIPVVAILAVLVSWNVKARSWLGMVFPLLASGTLIAALLTGAAGEALATQVEQTDALTAHTSIADMAVAGAFLLVLSAWAQWVWDHRYVRASRGRTVTKVTNALTVRKVSTTIAVVQTLIAVFAVVAIVIVGDTGARAVWQG